MFEEKIAPAAYLHIEGPVTKAKNHNDGGTSHYSMNVDATTSIIKAESFDVNVTFFPETKLKQFLELAHQKSSQTSSQNKKSIFGTIAFVVVNVDGVESTSKSGLEQLTIADGTSPFDRASLCFVNERKKDYHRLVEEFEGSGPVMLVTRNIGAWLSGSNTLSILDVTIIVPVANLRLQEELRRVFLHQVSNMGYGKETICSQCRTPKVCRMEGSEGHCFMCGVAVQIIEVPKLDGRITLPNSASVNVTLSSSIIDKVLNLGEPFKVVYMRSVLEAREALAYVKRVGKFVLNHMGRMISFSPDSHQ